MMRKRSASVDAIHAPAIAMSTPSASVLPIAVELGRTASTEFGAAGVWVGSSRPSTSVSKLLIVASFESVLIALNSIFEERMHRSASNRGALDTIGDRK